MGKIRLNLVAVLMVAMGAIAALAVGITHFDGWERWACTGGTIVVSIAALAVVAVLGATLLTTTGDLWDTWWFRRMRKFWGNSFGGPDTITDPETEEVSPRPLQISICRAVNLSAGAILCTATISIVAVGVVGFLIGTAGALVYLAVVGALNGIDTPSNFLLNEDSSLGENIGAFLIFGGFFIQLIVAFFWAVVTNKVLKMLKPTQELEKRVWKTFASIFILSSILIFLFAPIHTVGVGEVLKWLGIMLGGIFGAGLALALLGISIWGMIRISKKLSGETVAGVLLRSRIKAWKAGICPPIIQGEKFAL